MAGGIFVVTVWGGAAKHPGCTGQPLTAKVIRPRMSMLPKLRNPASNPQVPFSPLFLDTTAIDRFLDSFAFCALHRMMRM